MISEVEAHGANYRIHNPGGLIGQPLAQGRPYEAPVLEHIYETRREMPGIAVDVGANIGNHTLWLACICGYDVVAFEPVECDQLMQNVLLNGMQGSIRCNALALGSREGRAEYQGKGRLAYDPAGAVAVEPLDSLGFHDVEVGLIKIDVEDMEPEVLAGAEETIKQHRPRLFVEARDEDAHGKVAALLEPWGFRWVKSWGATPLGEWVPC